MPGCAQAITTRGLDQYYNTEEDCLVKKGDLNAIVKLLQVLATCSYHAYTQHLL